MNKILIAPSILSADFANLEAEIRKVENAGADLIHVDVMDGVFVPNITIGAPVVKSLRQITKLPLDVHLMIVEPEKHIADFVKAGADIVTVHAEACDHLDRTVSQIQELGAKAGVSINPHTHEMHIEHILGKADLILVMSVNPGFGGQKFIPYSAEKIKSIRKMAESKGRKIGSGKTEMMLEVDGGIGPGDTAKAVINSGANVIVAGSAIYGARDVKAAMDAIRLV